MKNKITQLVAIIAMLSINASAWACPVCEKQQPKITLGLTHGAGPQSNWDWLIIGIISVVTLLTFIFSLKYLITPGEKDSEHIKQSILNN